MKVLARNALLRVISTNDQHANYLHHLESAGVRWGRRGRPCGGGSRRDQPGPTDPPPPESEGDDSRRSGRRRRHCCVAAVADRERQTGAKTGDAAGACRCPWGGYRPAVGCRAAHQEGCPGDRAGAGAARPVIWVAGPAEGAHLIAPADGGPRIFGGAPGRAGAAAQRTGCHPRGSPPGQRRAAGGDAPPEQLLPHP